jgi:glucose/arabinose dehydrogenase
MEAPRLAQRPPLDRRAFLLAGAAGALAACSSARPTSTPSAAVNQPGGADQARPEPASPAPATSVARGSPPGTVSTIATGLNVPWGLAFLPSGDAVVNERETGRVLRISEGGENGGAAIKALITLPGVDTTGTSEGGLLGLAVSPTYTSDQLLFAYYTAGSDNRIVSFTIAGGSGSVHPILTGLKKGNIHNGGRIAFGPDGKLYAGVGETGERGLAQDTSSLNGKILRINADGSIPPDNPSPGSAIWTLGHRNVQGLAWDSAGQMWSCEFGQDRFDEVNLVQKGRNYGWPTVEGVGDTNGGEFTNPKVTWPTSEASPSGCAIDADTMYIGALQGKAILRVALGGTNPRKDTPLFAGRYGRLRTAVVAPDGSLWFTTSNRDGRGSPADGDDRIFRLQL